MVSQNSAPPKGGHARLPSQGYVSFSGHVLMCVEIIDLTMCAKTYDTFLDKDSNEGSPEQPITSTTHPLFVLFI